MQEANPITPEAISRVQTGQRRDSNLSFGSHYSARVLRVVTDEWRSDKLIMPEVPVRQNELPQDENDQAFKPESENSWTDLSVNEMVNLANLSLEDREKSDQNDINIFGFYLDNRFYSPNSSII